MISKNELEFHLQQKFSTSEAIRILVSRKSMSAHIARIRINIACITTQASLPFEIRFQFS